MFNLSKKMIADFLKPINEAPLNNAFSYINKLINRAMFIITSKNSLIYDYEVLIGNEALTKTATPYSSLDIYLLLDAVQLELNYEKNNKKNVLKHIKSFFVDFFNNFKLVKSKNTKKRLKTIQKRVEKITNYDVLSFCYDLQVNLCKKLSINTKTVITNTGIKIMGKEELGVEVNIYPVFQGEDYDTIYNLKTKKHTIINFNDKIPNFDAKNLETDNQYERQIKLFNSIFFNIFERNANQIFIESLLYNVPDNLFVKDDYITFVNVLNFLKNSTMQNFVSICDKNVNLFKDPLNTISFETAYKFINTIKIVD